MKQEFICTICPQSCEIATEKSDDILQIFGNKCDNGVVFAEQEIFDPQRVLTTTVKLSTGGLLPVRSSGTVKKRDLKELVKQLKSIVVTPPIEVGDIIFSVAGEFSVEVVAADHAE